MFVLRSTSGQGFVRACPPEIGFEYVSNPVDALKFATEADALAYLTAQHPVRKSVPQRAGGIDVLGPILGYFTRQERSSLTHYAINIGDL